MSAHRNGSEIAIATLAITVLLAHGCDHRNDAPLEASGPISASSGQHSFIDKSLPAEPLTVRITGHDYQWRIRYPGSDGILDSDDDILSERNLHLPENRRVLLELCSDDFAYTLFLPHFDFLDVAMPDSPYTFELTTDEKGNHQLLGSQMCGYTHPLLIGKLLIHSETEFESWLASVP